MENGKWKVIKGRRLGGNIFRFPGFVPNVFEFEKLKITTPIHTAQY